MESIETGVAAGQIMVSGMVVLEAVVLEAVVLGEALAEAEVALAAAAHRGDGK